LNIFAIVCVEQKLFYKTLSFAFKKKYWYSLKVMSDKTFATLIENSIKKAENSLPSSLNLDDYIEAAREQKIALALAKIDKYNELQNLLIKRMKKEEMQIKKESKIQKIKKCLKIFTNID
jgi:hypothetical protein